MPDYNCESCQYSTKIKTHFQRHLNSKKHTRLSYESPPKTKNIPNIPQYTAFSRNYTAFSRNYTAFPRFFQNNSLKENEEKRFICPKCNKVFTRNDSLTRHMNETCKEQEQEPEIDPEQEQKYKELDTEKQYNELLNLLEKEREDHKEQLDKVLDKVGNTTINNHTNLMQTNNVQVNNYGSENLEMLTDNFMKKLVSFPYTAIPKMIKKIHFNDKYPENKNIRMLNKRDGKLQILTHNKWTYVDKRDQMIQLIDDKNYILDKYYEDNKNIFAIKLQSRFDNFQCQYSENDKNIKSENNKETELVFWNSM